ncbi:uncharacterized protein CTHT_0011630 [Thermochaetoides thermophila DSM 1495]|uniref:Uncharacterized protein n=1 Tax=Chaetomium thermophilum (strain DSM 1495 / CBS 144.50 / IMI 039719) TaxID=759272 RepID=G0S0Y0_CHATD|nr:hypothetical protein CTHT_0011630 [Thermochaetoides thermophila DSM 1495]EGS22690.1 hypothetical protein CTHT_0011630 [Thermochaetoides thermophila DSM 1495]
MPPVPPAARSAARAALNVASKSATSSAAPKTGREGQTPKWKLWLYTGVFTAVTVTGTIYGAGLKTQQEWKAEKKRVLEASVEEKIAILEDRKAELVRQKNDLEAKLEEHALISQPEPDTILSVLGAWMILRR